MVEKSGTSAKDKPAPVVSVAEKKAAERKMRRARVSPVQVKMTIVHVWSVDIRCETFRCSVQVDSKWRCPAESLADALENGVDIMDVEWKPEWVPRLTILYTTALLHQAPDCFHATLDEAGTCWIHGTFAWAAEVHERYDLRMFPFDVQDLNVQLRVENAQAIAPLESDSAAAGVLAQVDLEGSSLPDLVAARQPAFYRRETNF